MHLKVVLSFAYAEGSRRGNRSPQNNFEWHLSKADWLLISPPLPPQHVHGQVKCRQRKWRRRGQLRLNNAEREIRTSIGKFRHSWRELMHFDSCNRMNNRVKKNLSYIPSWVSSISMAFSFKAFISSRTATRTAKPILNKSKILLIRTLINWSNPTKRMTKWLNRHEGIHSTVYIRRRNFGRGARIPWKR